MLRVETWARWYPMGRSPNSERKVVNYSLANSWKIVFRLCFPFSLKRKSVWGKKESSFSKHAYFPPIHKITALGEQNLSKWCGTKQIPHSNTTDRLNQNSFLGVSVIKERRLGYEKERVFFWCLDWKISEVNKKILKILPLFLRLEIWKKKRREKEIIDIAIHARTTNTQSYLAIT